MPIMPCQTCMKWEKKLQPFNVQLRPATTASHLGLKLLNYYQRHSSALGSLFLCHSCEPSHSHEPGTQQGKTKTCALVICSHMCMAANPSGACCACQIFLGDWTGNGACLYPELISNILFAFYLLCLSSVDVLLHEMLRCPYTEVVLQWLKYNPQIVLKHTGMWGWVTSSVKLILVDRVLKQNSFF